MNLLRKLLFALLALPLGAGAATVTHKVATPDTTVSPNVSGAFTPASGDLLMVMICATGTVDATMPPVSSVGGFTFSLVDTITWASSSHTGYLYVSDAFAASATSQTVSVSAPSDEYTGTTIMVAAVSGMTLDGLDAIRQSADQNNQTGAATPTTVFSGNALTGNPTLGFVCANGNPPNVTEPSGWTEAADVGYDTPSTGGEYVFRNSGFTSTTITWGSTYGAQGAAISVELDASAGSSPPAFSSGPTVTGIADGFQVAGTVDANATVYFAGLNPGATPPADCTALQALSGSALWFGNEAWTASSGDSFDVTDTGLPVRINGYVCAANGDGATDVIPFNDKDRLPRDGKKLVTFASISATGLCDLDDDFDPDCAVGDGAEYDEHVAESEDCEVTIGTDGDVEYTPNEDGACNGRLTFEADFQDVSKNGDGTFIAPENGDFTTPEIIVSGDEPVTCEVEAGLIVWIKDEAIVDLDLNAFCNHPLGDTLAYESTGDALPTGLAKTDSVISGTPTVEDETGLELEYEACNVYGSCATLTLPTIFIVETFTVPDLSGMTVSEAIEAILTAAPWRESDVGLSIGAMQCSEETPGTVIAQDPAAEAEIEAFDEISVTLARFCSDGTGRRKTRLGLGVN